MTCNHRPTFREFRKDINGLEKDDIHVRFVCKFCGESIYLDAKDIQQAKKLRLAEKVFDFFWIYIAGAEVLIVTIFGGRALLPSGGALLSIILSIFLAQYISFRKMVFGTKCQNQSGNSSPAS